VGDLFITDPGDPRVGDYSLLADPHLARERGVFVAEGRLVVARVIESGRYRIRSVLLNAAARRALAGQVQRLGPDVPVYISRTEHLEMITGFNIHRGCLAIVERPAALPLDSVLAGATLVVALDGVTNADNVGGVFRNAAAFGVDAVVLSPAAADPLYRKAVRTSMGATLQVPFARTVDWSAALATLQERAFTTVALTPDPAAEPLDSMASRPAPRRMALLVGAEGDGLSAESIARADHRVRIPTRPEVDSLNLAVATGIALSRLTGADRLTSRTTKQR
jgi:tRNA G18 (ribose-2'-O)-methylase SpoU